MAMLDGKVIFGVQGPWCVRVWLFVRVRLYLLPAFASHFVSVFGCYENDGQNRLLDVTNHQCQHCCQPSTLGETMSHFHQLLPWALTFKPPKKVLVGRFGASKCQWTGGPWESTTMQRQVSNPNSWVGMASSLDAELMASTNRSGPSNIAHPRRRKALVGFQMRPPCVVPTLT